MFWRQTELCRKNKTSSSWVLIFIRGKGCVLEIKQLGYWQLKIVVVCLGRKQVQICSENMSCALSDMFKILIFTVEIRIMYLGFAFFFSKYQNSGSFTLNRCLQVRILSIIPTRTLR